MRSPQRAFTLIELIVAITVVGIAATTILGTIAAVARRSADPMLQQQAIAIALRDGPRTSSRSTCRTSRR